MVTHGIYLVSVSKVLGRNAKSLACCNLFSCPNKRKRCVVQGTAWVGEHHRENKLKAILELVAGMGKASEFAAKVAFAN